MVSEWCMALAASNGLSTSSPPFLPPHPLRKCSGSPTLADHDGTGGPALPERNPAPASPLAGDVRFGATPLPRASQPHLRIIWTRAFCISPRHGPYFASVQQHQHQCRHHLHTLALWARGTRYFVRIVSPFERAPKAYPCRYGPAPDVPPVIWCMALLTAVGPKRPRSGGTALVHLLPADFRAAATGVVPHVRC